MQHDKTLIFCQVVLAFFLDMMVYMIIVPVLPTYSMARGASDLMVGVIFGVYSISLLLSSIPFGLLSDRVGRWPVLVIGMVLLTLANITFSVSRSTEMFIAARAIEGVSSAATWSAGLALLADTYGRSERGLKLGLAMSVTALASVVGPSVGGLAYERLGYSATFLIPSVMAAATAVLFMFMRLEYRAPVISHNIHIIPGTAPFSTLIACAATIIAGAASYGVLEPYMPVYLYERFSASPSVTGGVFSIFSLISMAAMPIAGRLYDMYGGRKVIPAGLVLSGVIIVAFMLMDSMQLTVAVFSLLGATLSLVLMPVIPMMSDIYASNGRNNVIGFAYGLYNSLFSAGLAVGTFAGGLAVSSFTLSSALFGHALMLSAAGLAIYALIRMPGNASRH